MFSNKFLHDSKIIFWSKTITFFGNSFSKLVLPLFVLEKSGSLTHSGMQWAVIALTQLLSAYISPYLNIFKSDKSAVFTIDVLLMIATLIPLLFFNSAPVISTYTSTFLLTLLTTLQFGYLESILGHIYEGEKDISKARNHILGSNKTGENIGQLLGFSIAGLTVKFLGYKIAFITDAITFIISAALILRLKTSGARKNTFIPKASFSLVFSNKLKYLSYAQICAAFATFTMNGIWIVVLKEILSGGNDSINIALISQFIFGLFGSYLFMRISKKHIINDQIPYFFRLSYLLVFTGMAYTDSPTLFIILYATFSFIINFSLPAIQAMFQREVLLEELRGVGVARIGINSVSGSIAAALASLLLNYVSYKVLFSSGAIISIVGAIFFKKHINIAKNIKGQRLNLQHTA